MNSITQSHESESRQNKNEKTSVFIMPFLTLRKLWRGQISLVKTFWLYGVLAYVLSVQLTHAIKKHIVEINSTAWIFVIVSLVFSAYQSVVVVGCWRSTRNYEQHNGGDKNKKLIANLTYLTLIYAGTFLVLAILIEFYVLYALFTYGGA